VDSRRHLIARLQAEINATLSSMALDEAFALLDFPDHSNVGDSAIWLGELTFFAQSGYRPSYVCSLKDVAWSSLDRAVPHGAIFIHGGGNFGDIWPRHQAFREQVLERYPGRKVVQLPQSIHFRSADNIARMARVIAEHGRFTLLVRDRSSFDLATRWFDCQVILCPDMAFCLGPLPRSAKPQGKTLLLLRTDDEKADIGSIDSRHALADIVHQDWLVEPRATKLNARYVAMSRSLGPLLTGRLQRERLKEEYFRQLAAMRVNRGVRMLAPYAYIVSDRLHVHILSTLLGIRHCMLDNSYGKTARFMETWSTMWKGVLRTDSIASALQLRP